MSFHDSRILTEVAASLLQYAFILIWRVLRRIVRYDTSEKLVRIEPILNIVLSDAFFEYFYANFTKFGGEFELHHVQR